MICKKLFVSLFKITWSTDQLKIPADVRKNRQHWAPTEKEMFTLFHSSSLFFFASLSPHTFGEIVICESLCVNLSFEQFEG